MSLERAKQLREEKARLWERQKELVGAAEGRAEKDDHEGPLFTDEERQELEKIESRMREQTRDIEALESAEERRREMEDSPEPRSAPRNQSAEPEPGSQGPEVSTNELYNRAFRYMMAPEDATDEQRAAYKQLGGQNGMLSVRLGNSQEARKRQRYVRQRILEGRQMSTSDGSGGEWVPEGFRSVLEEALLAFGGARQLRSTILRTATGNNMPMPTVDDTDNKGAILSENTQDSEQDVTTDSEELGAFKYTSRIVRVPIELLQDSEFDVADYLSRALGERIGRATNEHFTVGSGNSEPHGFMTASAEGHEAGASDIDFDDVLELIHSVDPAYRSDAEFTFNDATLLELKKLKDNDGRYLWTPGVAVREPDRVWGFTYIINQDIEDIGSSTRSMAFGDFSKFFIRDVMDVTVRRLVERYADYHQEAFVAISRHDSEYLNAGTDPIKHLAHAA